MALPGPPPEIWMEIFYLACTDGGNTGRALSLVSRACSECSRRSKFRSIALTGIRQLSTFVDVLQSLDPCYRNTENLFVSNYTMPTSSQSAEALQAIEVVDRRRLIHWTEPSDEEARWSEKLSCLLHILRLHLRNLAVHGNVPRTCNLLTIELPNLLELSIHTPIVNLFPTPSKTLPQLQYLKMAIYPVQPLALLRDLRSLTPKLKGLLLAVVEKHSEFYHPVQEALQRNVPGLPPWELEEIHIQPSIPIKSFAKPEAHLRKMSSLITSRTIPGVDESRVSIENFKTRWTVEEALEDWLGSITGPGGLYKWGERPKRKRGSRYRF
ncbi:F-box domain-containing protein [Pleurotus pulmonarius]|nr:hypothetical protein EYR36_005045 [Pleurotus pulmonarius]